MKDLEQKIIDLYEEVEVREIHPTYREIAKKAKCSKSYVAQVVKIYKIQTSAFGLKK